MITDEEYRDYWYWRRINHTTGNMCWICKKTIPLGPFYSITSENNTKADQYKVIRFHVDCFAHVAGDTYIFQGK